MALILVLSVGISYSQAGCLDLGFTKLSGLAAAALVGIILNAVLPGKDYEFGTNDEGDQAVGFDVSRRGKDE